MSINGLLLVDKPKGCTSHDLVHQLRKKFKFKSVGHAGTLDPLATGLMVLLVGEATKLSDYFLQGDKAYIVQAKLGIATDTDDITGSVIEHKEINYSQQLLEDSICNLQGELSLEVPIYSAIKKEGKKLYEYAREKAPGQEVAIEIPKRTMHFYEAKLLQEQTENLDFYLRCSKGSYVRSWVRQLGVSLKTLATVNELRRVHSAPYDIEQTLKWDQVMGSSEFAELAQSNSWIPMEKAMPHWPSFKVDSKDERLFQNGAVPYSLERFFEIQFPDTGDRGIKVISRRSGKLISLVGKDEHNPFKFKVKRVFAH